MATRTRLEQGVPVLECEGRITAGPGSAGFRDAGQAALTTLGRFMVVDLGRTKMMDSSGLGELVALKQAVGQAGGQVVLARVPDHVTELLQRAGLLPSLEIFGSAGEAVRFITHLDDYP